MPLRTAVLVLPVPEAGRRVAAFGLAACGMVAVACIAGALVDADIAWACWPAVATALALGCVAEPWTDRLGRALLAAGLVVLAIRFGATLGHGAPFLIGGALALAARPPTGSWAWLVRSVGTAGGAGWLVWALGATRDPLSALWQSAVVAVVMAVVSSISVSSPTVAPNTDEGPYRTAFPQE